MKETICTVVGVVGSFVAWLFGGWDASIPGTAAVYGSRLRNRLDPGRRIPQIV